MRKYNRTMIMLIVRYLNNTFYLILYRKDKKLIAIGSKELLNLTHLSMTEINHEYLDIFIDLEHSIF